MKKILSLMALLLLTVATAWAGTATVSYNNSEVSDPEGFFTHDANGKFGFNSKFTDAEYDGINFTSGLKMEGTTKILFTTTEESTVTIVQSDWQDKNTPHGTPVPIKFDGTTLNIEDAEKGVHCYIYTIENVAAGDHNITRGSAESGIFYVKAEWTDAPVTKTVYFDNTATQWGQVNIWAWNDTENFTGGEWPGVKMEETTETPNLYKWTTEGNPTKVIFSNNGANQTSQDGWDFVDGATYNKDGRVIIKQNFTLTFQTEKEWEEIYAYAWNDSENSGWKANKMTKDGDVWTATVQLENEPTGVLFHNGNGDQTPDFVYVADKTYEYMLNTYTATFTTDANWETVKAYVWTGEGENEYLGEWPGTALTANEGVYTVTIKTWGDAPEKIIFNDGGSSQTSQDGWTFVNDKAYAYIINPLFAIKAGVTYTYGQTVYVADADKDVVATLTFGNKGENGNNFNETTDEPDKIEGYASFSARTNGGNGANGNQTGGTTYTIKPLFDGKVSIAVKLGANKVFYIKENGTALDGYNGITKSDTYYGTFDFNVTAGKEYKFYCDGSKLDFYGFNFTGYTKSEPNFKVAGSMTDWNKLYVYADSYTIEDLAADTEYKFKVIDNSVWKSYSDLTDVATGLYTDNDGNVCFKLNEAGNVTVNYKSGELFTVEGDFVLPQVVLAGTMTEWETAAKDLTPAGDKKSASVTIALEAANYEFKMIVDGNWLTREGESESQYELHRGWRTVDGVSQSSGKNMLLEADVAGDYTFTWEYATNTLTVTFPTGDLTLYEDADNTDALTEWDGTSANVTLTRTLKTGMWNTFAAPFSIEKPAGWTVKELTGATLDGSTLNLTFEDATSIVAGKPYLVKVNSDLDFSTMVMANVTVGKTLQPVTFTYVDFVPTLGKTLVTGPEGDESNKDAVLFLAADNKLVNPTVVNDPEDAASYIKGFRAYFLLKGDAANARVFNLDLGEGETTSISEKLKVDSEQFAPAAIMYDLQGRRVQNAAQKGVYIMNGRKVVKK